MIKRITSIFMTVCLLICLSALFFASAEELSVDLSVGTVYPEDTLIKTIEAETEDIKPISSSVQQGNGITFKFVSSGKTIKLVYSGKPETAEQIKFDASYTDGGKMVEYIVTFNVKDAEKPVINKVSPEKIESPVKQTDPEIIFSVNASGNGTLSYKWFLDDSPVGGNESAYNLIPADVSVDPAKHVLKCVVSLDNAGKAEYSWMFDLVKGDAPKITSTESAAEISGTGSVKFSVEADGDKLEYQWYVVTASGKEAVVDGKYGAVEYSGGTNKTLKITCTTAPSTVTTKFICVVTNKHGLSSDTGEYILYVKEDPSLNTVQSISVSKLPSKTTYTVGETLDISGMELSVVTGKGTEKITSGFACSPQLLEKEGTKVITVSYGGKTTNFSVTVKKANHTHEWSEWVVDDANSVRIYRECRVEGCTAKEIFIKNDFIERYPEEAKKLGLEADVEEDDINKPDNTDDVKEPNEEDKNVNKPATSPKKTGSTAVLWIIIIVAAALLAAACMYYFKVYKKPAKKKGRSTGTGRPSGRPGNTNTQNRNNYRQR